MREFPGIDLIPLLVLALHAVEYTLFLSIITEIDIKKII